MYLSATMRKYICIYICISLTPSKSSVSRFPVEIRSVLCWLCAVESPKNGAVNEMLVICMNPLAINYSSGQQNSSALLRAGKHVYYEHTTTDTLDLHLNALCIQNSMGQKGRSYCGPIYQDSDTSGSFLHTSQPWSIGKPCTTCLKHYHAGVSIALIWIYFCTNTS